MVIMMLLQMHHLNEIRTLGPTSETSAFPFESFFSDMRKHYRTRTVNIGKQVLENHALNYALGKHRCSKTMTHRAERTQRTDDCWIYQYDRANKSHDFFKVAANVCHGDGGVVACRVHIEKYVDGDLEWDRVGVYQMKGVSEEREGVDLNAIDGKAIIVDDLIVSIPYATLMENR
jgi:hypothetical protein